MFFIIIKLRHGLVQPILSYIFIVLILNK